MAPDAPRGYRILDVEVDVHRRLVRRGGQEVPLRQKAFDVLLLLLARRDRLVSKQELVEACWADAAITDDALVQCIRDIRRALGDDAREPRFIRTVAKHGYQLVAEVQELPDVVQPATAAGPVSTMGRSRLWRPLGLAAAVVLAVIAASAIWQTSRRFAPVELVESTTVDGRGPAIFVGSFANRTNDPESDWLRFGLPDMLITDLSNRGGTAVLGRAELQGVLSRRGWLERQMTLDEVLTAARDARADLAVAGSFAAVGPELRVDTEIYDVDTERLLGADTTVIADRAHLLRDVTVITAKVAVRLGQRAVAAGPQTLATAMTDDLDAYREYSLAVDRVAHLRNTEAIALLEQAIRRDPEFAMAYARIGYAYGVVHSDLTKARPYLQEAFKRSDRLTDRDRRVIAAWDALVRADFPAAITAYERLIEVYPFDVEAQTRLARIYLGEDRIDDARQAAERALAIDAANPAIHNLLAGVYQASGRSDVALASARRYVELAPAEPNAYDTLGLALQTAGRFEEAVRAFDQAIASSPQFEVPYVHLGNVYVRMGRYKDAAREYRNYVDVAKNPIDRARGWAYLAFVSRWSGRAREAERAVERARVIDRRGSDRVLAELARGGAVAAKAALDALSQPWTSRGLRGEARFQLYANGMAAIERGDIEAGLACLTEVTRQRSLSWHIEDFERGLGDALLDLGRPHAAVKEFERILARDPSYPLIHYQLARAYEGTGSLDRAASEYRAFLTAWSGADRDIPAIIDAERRVASR